MPRTPRRKHTAARTLALSDQVTAAGDCVGAGNDAWFPIEPGPDAHTARAEYEATATALCASCPVKATCLELALLRGETHGIWGGTAPWQRDAMLRRVLPVQPAAATEEVAA